MIEKSLRGALLANATVAVMVGTRIYPMILPQARAWPGPSLTFQRISTTSPVALTGETGPERMRVQIDCWDDSWTGVRALAIAVKSVLQGFSGAAGSGGESLFGVFMDSQRDFFEPDAGPAGEGMYRVSQDFFVHVDMEVAA